MELEHPTATVLGKIDIAFGIRRDAMNLIEFTRKLPDPSKGRHHLAGLPIDDLYLRIVLVNVEDVFLVCVRRERERYHRAPVSLGLPSAGGVTGYGGGGAVRGGGNFVRARGFFPLVFPFWAGPPRLSAVSALFCRAFVPQV